MHQQQQDSLKIEFRFRLLRGDTKKFIEEYSKHLDVNDLIDMGEQKFQNKWFTSLKTPLLSIDNFEKIQNHIVSLCEQFTVTTTMEITNMANLKHAIVNSITVNGNKTKVKGEIFVKNV